MLFFLRISSFYIITCVFLLSNMQVVAGEAGQKMERPIFSPNAGAAVLYIYREKMLKGSAMGNIAYLNDVTIAQLENGEYVRFETPPGVYDLWITNMPERSQGGRFHAYTKEINLSSGEIYYFKIVPVFGFYWSLDINPIDKMTAQKDILKLYDISNN